MKIAIVGCGYVAEFYGKTLGNYPELTLTGAYDHQPDRLAAFERRWHCRAYDSLDALLADPSVEMVLNLTNPRSHFAISTQCLEHGKHVYSEKPLAMTTVEAVALAELAGRLGLRLASAPCSLLSESAQTLWKAVRDGRIGQVRVVYANFDDGMLAPRLQPWLWTNETGVPWPAKDEFEVGCTFEHAGYVLTWLGAMFGAATRVSSFASCQIPDKGIPVARMAPDFTVAGIEYASGVAARVTCGLVAPRDKSLTVVGDAGVLFVGDVRNDAGAVMWRRASLGKWESRITGRMPGILRWLEQRVPGISGEALFASPLPLVRAPRGRMVGPEKPVDFMRGPAELAAAIREGRPAALTAAFGAHIVELTERLQHPERFVGQPAIVTGFDPIAPPEWAR